MVQLISVIVPMYNIESELSQCLDSILSQTYTDLDIVLVDDGSTDGTAQVAKDYCARDNRCRLISLSTHRGAGAARNRGIAEARGEYICFVDGDDWVRPVYVERLWRALEKSGADLAVSGLSRHLDRKLLPVGQEISKVLSRQEALKYYCLSKISISFCTKLFKREAIVTLPISETRYYEDRDWSYRFLLTQNKIVWLDVADYKYAKREGSLTNSPYTQKQMVLLTIGEEIVKAVSQVDPSLESYAYYHTWRGITGQLLYKANYLGDYERVFFNAARFYCSKAWRFVRWHQGVTMLAMISGYSVFKVFRFYYLFALRLIKKGG